MGRNGSANIRDVVFVSGAARTYRGFGGVSDDDKIVW